MLEEQDDEGEASDEEAENETEEEGEDGSVESAEDEEEPEDGGESKDEESGESSSSEGSEDSDGEGEEEEEAATDDEEAEPEKTQEGKGKLLENAEKGGILKQKSNGKAESDEDPKQQFNSSNRRKEWMRYLRWRQSRKFPAKLAAETKTEEGRLRIFQHFIKSGCDKAECVLRVERVLTESQRTKLKYGFRNFVWLSKHHGEEKAKLIADRKLKQGLKLVCISVSS